MLTPREQLLQLARLRHAQCCRAYLNEDSWAYHRARRRLQPLLRRLGRIAATWPLPEPRPSRGPNPANFGRKTPPLLRKEPPCPKSLPT